MSGVSSRKPFELGVQLERPDKKRLKGGREVFLERGCRKKKDGDREILSFAWRWGMYGGDEERWKVRGMEEKKRRERRRRVKGIFIADAGCLFTAPPNWVLWINWIAEVVRCFYPGHVFDRSTAYSGLTNGLECGPLFCPSVVSLVSSLYYPIYSTVLNHSHQIESSHGGPVHCHGNAGRIGHHICRSPTHLLFIFTVW